MSRNIHTSLCILLLSSFFLMSCGTSGNTNSKKIEAPKQVSVDSTQGGIRVNWKPVPDAIGYTVFWGSEKGEFRNMASTKDCGALIEKVQNGEVYCVAVTSWGKTGESNFSEEKIVVFDHQVHRSSFHLSRATELVSKGSYDDAEAHFNAAIKLNPGNASAYKERGALHQKMQRHDLAKKDFETARKIHESKSVSMNNPS